MRLAGTHLGANLGCMPDGETGMRRVWINFLAAGAYDSAAALETVSRPLPVDPAHPEEWRGEGEHWVPRGYEDHWLFRVRDADALSFPTLGYAEEAIASYETFCQLREAGDIAADVRFMVSLPLAESATRLFVTSAADFDAMLVAYQAAVEREIDTICRSIPAEELAIQWDVCIEVLAVECDDQHPAFPWRPGEPPFDRYLSQIKHAASLVPAAAAMGLHLCYGDLGHSHLIEPPDLSVCVRLANAAHDAVERPIDFYHVPVPRDRDDDAYFAPLSEWRADGKLYIGLIHHTDGTEGSLKRLATAKRHAENFGLATECGFGRRPAGTMDALFETHRDLVAHL